MRYTFALLTEKLISELSYQPLFCHTAPLHFVKSFSTYRRGKSSDRSCIYLIDNSKGTRPLSSYESVACCIYISSTAEEKLFSSSQVGSPLTPTAELPYKTWIEGREDISLLVLPSTVSKRQLEQALVTAFSFYHEWSETVLQKILAQEDWFSLLESAHALLKNPMLIYDNTMKVLAYTRDDGTSDSLWTDTVASGTAHINSKEESLELLKYIEKLEQNDTPFRHTGKGMTDPFYSCNIMAEGCRIGMVTITEHNHTVTQGQLDLLWNFSLLLSIQMRQENAQKHQNTLATRQLLTDLLDGSITSRATLNTRLTAVRLDCLPFIRLLRFDSTVPYISNRQWSEGLSELSALPLHGLGTLLSDRILYLCTSETAELSTALTDALAAFCMRHNLRCGISDPFTDLLHADRYHTQPDLALSLSNHTLCFFEEVRFATLTRHLQSYPNHNELIHPAVRLLHRLDQENGTEYLKTLRALFENQYSQVGAALSLGIHRTTLFYRQQKIEELTGISFRDAQAMLHIQISLLIEPEE